MRPLFLFPLAIRLLAQTSQPDPVTVDRYVQLTEWLLGLEYSPVQKSELRAAVQGYWRDNNQKSIGVVRDSMRLWTQLSQSEPDLRATALASSRPELLINLQKDPGADSQWLYQQYLRANPPLAQGKPGSVPLTRASVNAALEHERFLQGEVLRRPVRQASLERAYAAAARSYGTLSVPQQLDIARKAGQLASQLGHWRRMSPLMRAMVRQSMGGNLSHEDTALLSEFRNHGNALLTGELSHMRQNSETIMGRGTVWNSNLGRWEQQGGIKTEYDTNVVRVP